MREILHLSTASLKRCLPTDQQGIGHPGGKERRSIHRRRLQHPHHHHHRHHHHNPPGRGSNHHLPGLLGRLIRAGGCLRLRESLRFNLGGAIPSPEMAARPARNATYAATRLLHNGKFFTEKLWGDIGKLCCGC